MNAPAMPTTVRVEAARSLLERMGEKNALLRFFRLNACAKHGVPISDNDIWSRNIVVDRQTENSTAVQPAASAPASQSPVQSGSFPWAALAAVVSTLALGLGGGYLLNNSLSTPEQQPASTQQVSADADPYVWIQNQGGHLP